VIAVSSSRWSGPRAGALAAAGSERIPDAVLADAGYWSGRQVKALMAEGMRVLVPADAHARTEPNPRRRGGLYDEIRGLLRSDEGNQLYGRRMTTIEPLFGQTKANRRTDRFLRPGLTACAIGVAPDHRHPQSAQALASLAGSGGGLTHQEVSAFPRKRRCFARQASIRRLLDSRLCRSGAAREVRAVETRAVQAFLLTERRWNRTIQAEGSSALPVLKTSSAFIAMSGLAGVMRPRTEASRWFCDRDP
jgi:hypothetical protein